MTKKTYDREAMIAEALDLGIDFKGNISNANLEALIYDFKGEPVPVDDPAPPSPEAKADDDKGEDDQEFPHQTARNMNAAQVAFAKRRKKIAEAKRKALRKRIVTITNKDPRENEVMTTVYLSCENQHFGIARLVPLDMPVELEECLIKIAAATTMTQHRDEVIKGRRTGNKVTVTVKKYAISYSSQKSDDQKNA